MHKAQRGARGHWRTALACALLLLACATNSEGSGDASAPLPDGGTLVKEAGQAGEGGAGGACAVPCAPAAASTCVSDKTLRRQEVRGCGPDRCDYPTFDSECPGGCSSGACVGADPCAGVSCTTPPAASCSAAGKLVTWSGGRCQNGSCAYTSTETTCANGCENGACKGEPCAGVTCTQPPPASCADPSTRRSYAATGTCASGTCSYAPTDTTCPYGCENGACKTTGCAAGMCAIPAGSFTMGSNTGFNDQKPEHTVTLAAFEIDELEVSVAQYRACMTAGACTPPLYNVPVKCDFTTNNQPNRPIGCVSKSQATAYCTWVGKRLPTEEEWEYAARGNDGREYPWGNAAPSNQLCWNQTTGTCDVGTHPSGKSPFGVQDMGGNVYEFTSSAYSLDYNSPRNLPLVVIRGGGWATTNPALARAANRAYVDAVTQSSNLGIRCCR